jgi:multiple sugar transport system permease protein
MKQKHNEWIWGWALVAPTIVGLLILNIIPIFQTVFMTFFKTGSFGRGNIFIGLENYRTLFSDSQVWRATGNTLLYTLIVVPCTVVIAMLLAVLMNSKIAGRSIYRTIYFIPMIAPPAAVTMVWRWMYNSQFGLINHALAQLGIQGPNWITGNSSVLAAVSIIGIWSTVGYCMVLLLAGLQEIPADYFEAAEIDGASPMRKFFMITLPLVSPTLFFVITTSVIAAMQVFDVIFMMIDYTNPALPSIQSLVYLFYNYSFKIGNKGYGSTVVILLLLIIMLLTVVQNRLQKKWVTYM